MKLSAWIALNPRKAAGLARRIKVTRQAFHRYAVEARIPRPDPMRRIYLLTEGLVDPNSFYDLPDVPARGPTGRVGDAR